MQDNNIKGTIYVGDTTSHDLQKLTDKVKFHFSYATIDHCTGLYAGGIEHTTRIQIIDFDNDQHFLSKLKSLAEALCIVFEQKTVMVVVENCNAYLTTTQKRGPL